MKNNIALLGMAALLTASLSQAQSGQPNFQPSTSAPTMQERLPNPVQLSCAGMRVVEWKPSRFLPEKTSMSAFGIDQMNTICNLTISKYPDFMRMNKYQFDEKPIDVQISLLPANTMMDGKESRNLNDTAGRFITVQPMCCSWGIWDTPSRALFLRNDPVSFVKQGQVPNKYFARTMAHEMMHVLNAFYNARALNNFDGQRDEELAEEFVTYLGFNFKTESSSQDLAFKIPPR